MPIDQKVLDAMVEAGAKAIYALYHDPTEWDASTLWLKDRYRNMALAAIPAALRALKGTPNAS